MPAAQVILWLGYASLLLELVVLAVPSVASTRQERHGRPRAHWVLGQLLPAVLAVTGFLLPLLLSLWPAARAWSGAVPAWADAAWVQAAGIGLVVLGRVLTVAAVLALRRQPATSAFVAHGPYALCRNPALLGLHAFLLGAVLLVPGWLPLLGLVVFVLHMHRRVHREEQHLRARAGAEYTAYLARVRRYLPTGARRVPK